MYKIKFSENAAKVFYKLDVTIKNKISNYLDREVLLKNPKSFGKPLLYAHKGNWRYRVENYRIICRIEEEELLIVVLEVGHRKNIYK